MIETPKHNGTLGLFSTTDEHISRWSWNMKLPAFYALFVASCTVQSAAATPLIDCYRYLLSRFNDFDGGVLDGLVSPSDIQKMGYLLPPDCTAQLLNTFNEADNIRGGAKDGLISAADVQWYIQRLGG